MNRATTDAVPEAEWPQWINGAIVRGGDANIDARDRGFLHGEAAFTTLRLRDGSALLLERHTARLARTIDELFSAGDAQLADSSVVRLTQGLEQLVPELPTDNAALRLTFSSGAPGAAPNLLVQARALPEAPAAGVRLCIEERYHPASGDPFELHKHIGRLPKSWARRRARARGAWDALLENTAGELTEATASNLVLVQAGQAWTPPLASGCLPGCVRDVLLAAGELRERNLTRADLECADEVLLTNSLLGAVGALAVELGEQGSRRIGNEGLPGASGPAVKRLKACLVSAEGDAKGP